MTAHILQIVIAACVGIGLWNCARVVWA